MKGVKCFMKTISLRKSLVLFLCVVLVLLMAACGGGSTQTSSGGGTSYSSNSSSGSGTTQSGSTDQSTDEEIKLTIMWWGSQSRHDATLQGLDLYTELNPNITFEPIFSGWDGYWDKLSTLVAANNAPDIIQMDARYLDEYVLRNVLAPLDDFDTSIMAPSLVDTGTVNGTFYAVPLGNNALGMVYNKSKVNELGLPEPKPNWTWDDYFNFAREARAKLPDDQYGIPDMTTIGRFEFYNQYQLSKGKGNVFADGDLNIDRDTWFEFQEIYQQLREENIVPPAQVMSADVDFDPQYDLFANETVLVRNIHAAQAGALSDLIQAEVGVVNTPMDVEGGGWLKPTFFFSVNAKSPYIEQSKDFIYWLLTDLDVAEISGTQRGVPIYEPVLEHILPSLSEVDLMGKEMIEMTTPNAQTYIPAPAGWSEYTEDFYDVVMEAIAYGQITIEEGYDRLMKRADEVRADLK